MADSDSRHSRRAFTLGASGLLLPAGIAGAASDPETERRNNHGKNRHKKRPGKPGMFANDTIIKFRNGTSNEMFYWFRSHWTDKPWQYHSVKAGAETGWMEHFPVEDLTKDAVLYIRTGPESEASTRTYMVTCRNFEVGTPDASIVHGKEPPPHWRDINTLADEVTLGEGVRMTRSDDKFTFTVHRWSNGKEYIDNNDEWYTRFFVTIDRK